MKKHSEEEMVEDIIEIVKQQRRRLERIEQTAQYMERQGYAEYGRQVAELERRYRNRVNKPLVASVVGAFFLLFLFAPNLALFLIFVVMGLGVIQLVRERKRNGK